MNSGAPKGRQLNISNQEVLPTKYIVLIGQFWTKTQTPQFSILRLWEWFKDSAGVIRSSWFVFTFRRTWIFSGVRVTQSVVFCVVLCKSLFVFLPFSFADCIRWPYKNSPLANSEKIGFRSRLCFPPIFP
jgi:hypothetical protein